MKIAAYNLHLGLLRPEPSWLDTSKSTRAVARPTSLCHQLTPWHLCASAAEAKLYELGTPQQIARSASVKPATLGERKCAGEAPAATRVGLWLWTSSTSRSSRCIWRGSPCSDCASARSNAHCAIIFWLIETFPGGRLPSLSSPQQTAPSPSLAFQVWLTTPI